MCGRDWSSDVCSSDLIQYHDIANIGNTVHHYTPRYGPSMKKQVIWYDWQGVLCAQELRSKIPSQRVLMMIHVRLTLDKCLSSVYPSPNQTL